MSDYNPEAIKSSMQFKLKAELEFIIKDCCEAASLGVDLENPKTEQYLATALFAQQELIRRK